MLTSIGIYAVGEAIILESTILSFRRPSQQTHKAFYNTFHNVEDGEETFPLLGGTSATVYDDRDDIMAIARPVEEDWLTVFLRKKCPILFMVSFFYPIPLFPFAPFSPLTHHCQTSPSLTPSYSPSKDPPAPRHLLISLHLPIPHIYRCPCR